MTAWDLWWQWGTKGTELGQQKAPSWQVQDMHPSGPLWKTSTHFAFSTHGLVFLSLFLFLLPSFCPFPLLLAVDWIGKCSPKVQIEVLSPGVMACTNHGRESDSEDRASWIGIVPLWRAPMSCPCPPWEQHPVPATRKTDLRRVQLYWHSISDYSLQNFWKINDTTYKCIFQCMVLGETSRIDIVTSAFSRGP